MLRMSLDSNKAAFLSSEVQELLGREEFDVLITVPLLGNEASYYLAHKKNSSLALFVTAPFSFPYINWAMGDVYNPAYMQSPVTGFSQNMNFLQRVQNTLATVAFVLFRALYANPKVESLLAECFPGEDIPPVDELLKSAGEVEDEVHQSCVPVNLPLSLFPRFVYQSRDSLHWGRSEASDAQHHPGWPDDLSLTTKASPRRPRHLRGVRPARGHLRVLWVRHQSLQDAGG